MAIFYKRLGTNNHHPCHSYADKTDTELYKFNDAYSYSWLYVTGLEKMCIAHTSMHAIFQLGSLIKSIRNAIATGVKLPGVLELLSLVKLYHS